MSVHKVEHSSKEIQVVFNGIYIAKTRAPLLVWEQSNRPPQYYLPISSLLSSSTEDRKLGAESPPSSDDHQENGPATEYTSFELSVDNKRTTYTVFHRDILNDYVRFEHTDMDAWIEDGALLTTFPKNPYRRIDTAITTAEIAVHVRETPVAKANHAVLLYETGLPVRYYLPATSVLDWSALKPSTKVTTCPYKGEAKYFDLHVDGLVLEQAIWYYPFPLAESAAVAGRLCFATTVDHLSVTVDGVKLET